MRITRVEGIIDAIMQSCLWSTVDCHDIDQRMQEAAPEATSN